MQNTAPPLALVIGADSSLCRHIGDQLHLGGFGCEIAPPLGNALELWKCNQHDLVILDQMAQEQGGLEICQAIRRMRHGNHTPFLVVGAHQEIPSSQALLDLGSSDFVALPNVGEELLPKARSLVKNAQTLSALAIGLEQLRETQLLARMGQWVWIPDGELLRFDDNVSQLFNRLFDNDLTLERYLRFVHPDDRQLVRNAFFELAWGGEHRLEYRLLECNQQVRYVSQRGSAFLRRGTIHYNGIIQDITAQRQTADRLTMLQDALDSLPIGITITDMQERIVYANPAEETLHGYARGELIGMPASALGPAIPPPANPGDPGLWQPWRREGLNRCKAGTFIPVQLHSNPVRNSKGDLIGIVTACEKKPG